MKYNNTHYAQVSRDIWDEKYHLSNNAKLLYVYLKELEQRYNGIYRNTFYQTNAQIAQALGWSESTVKRAKAELKAAKFIDTWYQTFAEVDQNGARTGKFTEHHYTYYTILR